MAENTSDDKRLLSTKPVDDDVKELGSASNQLGSASNQQTGNVNDGGESGAADNTTWNNDRIVNFIVGCLTTVLVVITAICAFFSSSAPRGLCVFFALCIIIVFLGHILLMYWYRQGDLDPKFRILIYYHAFTMVLLNICALSFFFV